MTSHPDTRWGDVAQVAAASVIAVAVALRAGDAHAGSGFELRSQSASTLGSAQAGMTCGVADVSTIVFNPAALGYGTDIETAINVTGLFTSVKFSETAATTILGTPIPGNSGGNAGTSVAIPNLYLGAPLADGWRVGLAIAPRFGLGSYWSSGWVGRYYAVDSELRTIDIVPTLSWRPDRQWSLGVGLDVQYAKIKTTSAIDFGTIDAVLTGGAFGGIPAGSDGGTSSNADSWGVGFTLGAIYEPQPGTRFGFDYHSKIRQSFKGDSTFSLGGLVGAGVAAVSGAFRDTSLSTDFDMPQMATAGLYYEVGADWAVMADLKWTDWSSFSSLAVNFGNPAQPPVQTSYAWRDSWFAAVGARYRVSDEVALRFGVAYDQTPARNDTRNPVIPDTDSYWLAVGLEYRFSPQVKLDLAYGHVFAKDGPIALAATTGDNAFRGNLSGNIQDSHVDYLAVQFAYRF
ncbi:MAG TPA: outer membrane protein transport protein [Casimicrobiaceae bacterium]|nr:outer membrane protein transport protein [Casimicrobiaceae bacterium]